MLPRLFTFCKKLAWSVRSTAEPTVYDLMYACMYGTVTLLMVGLKILRDLLGTSEA